MSSATQGQHVFITGAASSTGAAAVGKFLQQNTKVTAHDLRQIPATPPNPNFFPVTGDGSDSSIAWCVNAAAAFFGPITSLVHVSEVSDDGTAPDQVVDKTVSTIKSLVRAIASQHVNGSRQLESVSLVITSQEGVSGYSPREIERQYAAACGVIETEIQALGLETRFNAVAPGLILDELKESLPTAPPKTTAPSYDLARGLVRLTSRSARHITGKWLTVDDLVEGSDLWKPDPSLSPQPSRRIQVLLSVDFDAVSGFLGTGASPTNGLADFSSGYFAAQVGVPRLLRLFQKHGISSSVTWFVPGHSLESFPDQTKAIVDSGAEIGCHGYAHEGATQLSEEQERDVIEKCVKLATDLTGKKPLGWRAPLYQLRDHTVKVLEEHGFLYDTSLTHHDSSPYYLTTTQTPPPIDFSPSVPASTWMHPLAPPAPQTSSTLVEIPCNWYMEDMTPMQFLPAAANSHGFVSPETIESNWKARFDYLYNETIDGEQRDFVFPLVLHPDTSGMAHVVGMIDRVIGWLRERDGVEFVTFGECARGWKARQ